MSARISYRRLADTAQAWYSYSYEVGMCVGDSYRKTYVYSSNGTRTRTLVLLIPSARSCTLIYSSKYKVRGYQSCPSCAPFASVEHTLYRGAGNQGVMQLGVAVAAQNVVLGRAIRYYTSLSIFRIPS